MLTEPLVNQFIYNNYDSYSEALQNESFKEGAKELLPFKIGELLKEETDNPQTEVSTQA